MSASMKKQCPNCHGWYSNLKGFKHHLRHCRRSIDATSSEEVHRLIANQQKVLVIGHRVKLVEELCQRFGLNYISKIRDNPALSPLDQSNLIGPKLWHDFPVPVGEFLPPETRL